VTRVYDAHVLGVPDDHDISRLEKGLVIDGRKTEPADVTVTGPSRLRVTIREGRNRQVRKMCDAIGHPVTQLTRIAIGPLRDPKLKIGYWRELSELEVKKLRQATEGPVLPKPPRPRHTKRREPAKQPRA
jgi:23S rRNA pseudouridine2605 synthase